jgi:hypothetical protein
MDDGLYDLMEREDGGRLGIRISQLQRLTDSLATDGARAMSEVEGPRVLTPARHKAASVSAESVLFIRRPEAHRVPVRISDRDE